MPPLASRALTQAFFPTSCVFFHASNAFSLMRKAVYILEQGNATCHLTTRRSKISGGRDILPDSAYTNRVSGRSGLELSCNGFQFGGVKEGPKRHVVVHVRDFVLLEIRDAGD